MTPERREELITYHDSLIAACDEPGVLEKLFWLELAIATDPDAPHTCFDAQGEDCILCSYDAEGK